VRAGRNVGNVAISTMGQRESYGSFDYMTFKGGNIGIGTTSPAYKLDVTGTGNYTNILRISSGDQTNTRLNIRNSSSTGARTFSIVGGINSVGQDGLSIYDDVAAATRFVIHNSGNISIGNTNDIHKLEVNGTGRFTNQFLASYVQATGLDNNVAATGTAKLTGFGLLSNRSAYYYTNSGTINFTAGQTIHGQTVSHLLINTGGNISIGNTNNSYKLDVTGTGRFTGDVTANSFIGIDGTRKIITDDATTTHTVVSSDSSVVRRFTSSSPITVTVNTDSLANIGESAEIDQYGTGLVTIAAGTATLRINALATLVSSGQYSRISIQKMTSTEYRVFGELALA